MPLDTLQSDYVTLALRAKRDATDRRQDASRRELVARLAALLTEAHGWQEAPEAARCCADLSTSTPDRAALWLTVADVLDRRAVTLSTPLSHTLILTGQEK